MNAPRFGRRALVAALCGCFGAMLPCAAQTSASYKLTEYTFNNGGNPDQGSTLASSHYRIRLDAVGDGVIATGPGSASFHADAGFVSAYPPPGEVAGLEFTTKSNLVWDDERSVGTYSLYRDTLASLPGVYGSCYQTSVPDAQWVESANPAQGQGWFYLVTAKNRLLDEGTKGYRTGGIERSNSAPCP